MTSWRYIDMFISGSFGGRKDLLQPFADGRHGGTLKPSMTIDAGRGISTKAVSEGVTIQGEHAAGSATSMAVAVHLCEEADGINREVVFDAIRSMTGGGIALWFICLNPESPMAPVQKIDGPTVKRYALSCLDHPNVVSGQSVIPGAVSREWVDDKLTGRAAWAESVAGRVPNAFEVSWRPGQWYVPLRQWYWRVLGVCPPLLAGMGKAWPSFRVSAHRDPITLQQVAKESGDASAVRLALIIDEGSMSDPVFVHLEAYTRVDCPNCTRGYVTCPECRGRSCPQCVGGKTACIRCEGDGWLVMRWTLGERQGQGGWTTPEDDANMVTSILSERGLDATQIDDLVMDDMACKPGSPESMVARTASEALRRRIPGLPEVVTAAHYKSRPRVLTYRKSNAVLDDGRWKIDGTACPITVNIMDSWMVDSPHDDRSHGAACLTYATCLMHSPPAEAGSWSG
jgi:hypothetical protein